MACIRTLAHVVDLDGVEVSIYRGRAPQRYDLYIIGYTGTNPDNVREVTQWHHGQTRDQVMHHLRNIKYGDSAHE